MSNEVIQKLWGGYGTLRRISEINNSVIEKRIKFPPTPHPRKVKSYIVEKNWYQDYNDQVNFAYSPRYIKSGEENGELYLILEDLKDKNLSPSQILQIAGKMDQDRDEIVSLVACKFTRYPIKVNNTYCKIKRYFNINVLYI